MPRTPNGPLHRYQVSKVAKELQVFTRQELLDGLKERYSFKCPTIKEMQRAIRDIPQIRPYLPDLGLYHFEEVSA